MKKIKILFSLTLLASTTTAFAQLSPVAQALYTECYNNNVVRGQYSVTNGVFVGATPDNNSFYLQWFPLNATPANSPLLVTLHGTGGTAFDEFYLWHQFAAAHGVGIIAIQWYRGAAALSPYDYFGDVAIYRDIDTALTRIQYPSGNAFFHGFSRGSEISYAVAFRDVWPPNGKNYFCTIMSNSGRVEPDTTFLYAQIDAGMYGHNFYNGKKWGMFCGGLDVGIFSNCTSMNNSKLWVEANNGVVDLFISDDSLGHGGFQLTPAYVDSALNYYLQCYTPTSINAFEGKNENIQLFPNPGNGIFVLQLNNFPSDKTQFEIYDSCGKILLQQNTTDQQTKIDLSELAVGIYFLRVRDENGFVLTNKILKQ